MQVKTFVATVGLGMVAGAATMLLIPKSSDVYRVADDAAKALKHEATKMMNSMQN